jgi:protein involved in polysaccharide export with SLBB domain
MTVSNALSCPRGRLLARCLSSLCAILRHDLLGHELLRHGLNGGRARGVAGALVALGMLAVSALPLPAAAAPAEADLQMLMALPPEQRQALLEAMERGEDDEADARASTAVPRDRDSATTDGPVLPPPPPTLAPGSTVLLTLGVPEETAPGVGRPEALKSIVDGNPYRLDANGELQVPGVPPIALAGLNEKQAALRLRAERVFAGTNVTVTLLPLSSSGGEALAPFGYALFDAAAGNFAPVANTPVPADYLLGPGDSLRVNLVGGQNRRLTLEIDRNGELSLPEIGPLGVAGMRFEDASALIEQQVSEKMIGVQASVSMGTLRTMQVFILGEARQPGSYTVSGLSTVTNALVTSGGISPVGSLRDIQLKRNGATIASLDLYGLLLRGDTSGDVRLMPGDVIFVPPIGPTVSITGAVRRPAIYELRRADGQANAETLLRLAGGALPDADAAMAVIERIDGKRERVVLNVDLRASAAAGVRLQAGDLVRIPQVGPTVTQGLRIEGHVHRPGAIGFRAGMRLTDAIRNADALKPDADLGYVLIRREQMPDRRIVVLSADLSAAWRKPGGADDPRLKARDRLIVFDRGPGRARILEPLLAELRRQSSSAAPAPLASVEGRVKAPGNYPIEQDMRVSDLLRAGGGLDDSAYSGKAELARFVVVDGEQREMELLQVDLAAIARGDAGADVEIRPFDQLFVKEVPRWSGGETVQLRGEFRFPGNYPIRRGETLASLVERAGGLSELAFLDGAVFMREELREREQKLLDDVAVRMRRQWATLALRANGSPTGAAENNQGRLASGAALLEQVQTAKAVGRLVVDMEQALKERDPRAGSVLLKDGDVLFVPAITQEVTVVGEVQSPSSHLFSPEFEIDDYLRLSGGATADADESRVYVIRANGEVARERGGAWFDRAGSVVLRPGDSIVVPLDTERGQVLPLWTSVSTILYNIAVAVAAVGSL